MTLASLPPLADRITGRVVIENITWGTYSSLLAEIGDGARRLTYDLGLLEIATTSSMLPTFAASRNLTCRSTRRRTWRSK